MTMIAKKIYNVAPLPFQGQKRNWVKELTGIITSLPDNTLFVDLFGGSGLLSHLAKRIKPQAQVVYNDFDGYCDRLNAVNQTNRLLADIRSILHDYPNCKKIIGKYHEQVMERLELENESGFVDWITLSSSLLYSSNNATCLMDFRKTQLYNNCVSSNYLVDGYLDGLEVVKLDYLELFQRYKNEGNVIFFVDPPYLSTNVDTYKGGKYWKLKDYLSILSLLDGSRFVYFTSSKSNFVELLDWLIDTYHIETPLSNAKKFERHIGIANNRGYTDIMIVKV